MQLLRIILHKGVQKIYSRGFRRVSEKLHWLYFDQFNSKKNWIDLEMKVSGIKIKGIECHNTVIMIKHR